LSANNSDVLPLVSVIVTTRNEKDIIQSCILSIFDQSYSNFEVIVIDADSSDGTLQRAVALTEYSKSILGCKRYVTLSTEANSPARGRNIGVELSQGSIVAFIDADCIAEIHWLINLVSHLRHTVGMVGGPSVLKHFRHSIITDALDSALQTFLGSGGSPQFLRIKDKTQVYAVASCNMAIQKGLFIEVGGFNENLRYNEDSDLSNRIRKKGYKITYIPEARVNHFMGIDSYSDLSRLIYKYGFERGKNAAKDWHMLTKFNIISIAFVVTVLSLLLVSFFIDLAFLILFCIIGVVAMIILISSVKISIKNRSLVLFFLVVPVFLFIHTAYNFGFILGSTASLLSGLGKMLRL
jgi:glycosyltransferase involved in cell wall biosynthesis